MIKAMQSTKIMSPSTNCLSPIGADVFKKSLETEYDLEFVHAITRSPSVYRGNPFCIEVAIGYGGELLKDKPLKLVRFANRVPLLYQQGACAITKSVSAVDWKKYGLHQSSGNMPVGPIIVLVHMASVWAPFTSESKEAIAHYPEIIKETKLALQEAGRTLQLYIGRKQKHELAKRRKEIFKNYATELASSLSSLTGQNREEILKQLLKVAAKTSGVAEEEDQNESKKV